MQDIAESTAKEIEVPAGTNDQALERISDEDFVDLVAKNDRRLYYFILKNIGNPTDAEELAQQTFLEAYKALASFRGQSELSTWLLGIAMNLVRNYMSRAPHRRYEFVSDEILDTYETPDNNPADAAFYSQAMAQLSEALQTMPDELRQVLMLVAVDGIAYDEAAAMLAIPIGTVRSRLSRARATLRQRLPDVAQMIENG